MLRLDMDYDAEFIELYNHFNSTEKGKKYLELAGITRDKLDIASMSKLYFSNTDEDKTIDINANVGRIKSPNNYQAEIFKGLTKLNGMYLMWKMLRSKYGSEEAKKCINGVITGDFYFHDMTGSGVAVPYCFAWSSAHIFNGRNYGQLHSKPPKRSDSFIACCIESIFDMAQEQMGALAIPDFIVNLAYLYKREERDPKNEKHRTKIRNDFQRIVHCLNQQYRISNQSAFTNFSVMDRPTLTETFADYRYPDGSSINIEYIQEVQEIFIEFMAEKDPASGLPYRFPVTTLNMCVDENNNVLDQAFLDMACKSNTEGIFNIFITKGKAKLASCCRLLSDPVQLREYSRFDSFANSGLSLGSARVVTVNFARIGREAENETEYFKILGTKLEATRKLLKIQRCVLEKRVKEGFLKFFTMGWQDMSMFFSTFGMNGLFESLYYMSMDIRSDEGMAFAKKVFKYVEDCLETYSKEDKIAYNFEQVPAEGASSKLADMDKIMFGKEGSFDLYANQFVPLWEDCDLIERARIDGDLCTHMTGGSICHLNIGCEATPEQMNDLIQYAVKCGLEHFALNPNFNECDNGHITLGKSTDAICPKCGAAIIGSYTRVVGYFTPVNNWDKARRNIDFPNRKFNYFETEKAEVVNA